MGGRYKFFVPSMYERNSDGIYIDSGSKPWHKAPYRSTGAHLVELRALKLKKMLIKSKIKFKWVEKRVKKKRCGNMDMGTRITITF